MANDAFPVYYQFAMFPILRSVPKQVIELLPTMSMYLHSLFINPAPQVNGQLDYSIIHIHSTINKRLPNYYFIVPSIGYRPRITKKDFSGSFAQRGRKVHAYILLSLYTNRICRTHTATTIPQFVGTIAVIIVYGNCCRH